MPRKMERFMKKFKRLYIEITNTCNLSCDFCPKTSREPEFMDVALFEHILSEVKDHSDYFFFHVMGEPLMHPDIDTFLDLCDKNGCKINITTNGMFIKKAEEKLLSKPALRKINFSMHIFDKQTQDATVDEYLDNIFYFTDLMKDKPDFVTCFRFWNAKKSTALKEDIWGNGKNLYMMKKIEDFYSVPFSIKDTPIREKWLTIAENVYVQQAECFDWPNIDIPDLENKGFCLGLRQHVAILVDGTVVPCCMDNEGTINLGNIKKNTFEEIINSKRARDIYNGFSERKVIEPLCKKCNYRKRFD